MRFVLYLVVLLGLATAQSTKVYTPLEAGKCKTLEIDEQSGSSVQECPAPAGYRVFADEGDLRQNLRIRQGKKEFSLDLWTLIGSGFSSLGPKLEWRLQKGKPVALILRYNLSEDPADASKITSYLVVAKITASTICVTHKIPPSSKANVLAQQAADAAFSKPCLK